MNVNEAFEKFVKFQLAQNKPATVKSYVQRTKTFRHGFGNLSMVVELPDGFSFSSRKWLSQGHGSRPVGDVTPEDIDDWLIALKNQHTKWIKNNLRPAKIEELSQATISGRIQSIKTFFSFCEDRGYIERSPARHLRKNKVRKENHVRDKKMRLVDLYKIMDVVKERAGDGQPRDLAILTLMVESGMRPGEIMKLNIQDIDLERRELRVIDGKTGDRTVAFGEHTADAIEQYLPFRQLILSCAPADKRDDDAVFVGYHPGAGMGERIKHGTLNMMFRRLKKAAGVDGVCNPYSIRHLVGDHFAMRANVPLPLVAELLGHADITTTMMYVHPDMKKVKAAVVLHSPLNGYYANGHALQR